MSDEQNRYIGYRTPESFEEMVITLNGVVSQFMYEQVVVALPRDAVQDSMVRGLGIEERALLAKQRAKKVVGFPGNR